MPANVSFKKSICSEFIVDIAGYRYPKERNGYYHKDIPPKKMHMTTPRGDNLVTTFLPLESVVVKMLQPLAVAWQNLNRFTGRQCTLPAYLTTTLFPLDPGTADPACGRGRP